MLLASYMAGYQHSMCVGRSRCCRVHAHACDMKLFRVLPLPKPFTGSDLWVSFQNRGLWLVSSKTKEDMDELCERGLTVEADRRLWKKTPLLIPSNPETFTPLSREKIKYFHRISEKHKIHAGGALCNSYNINLDWRILSTSPKLQSTNEVGFKVCRL